MSPTPKRAKLGVAVARSSPPASRYFRRLLRLNFIKAPEGLRLVALRAGRIHPLRKHFEVGHGVAHPDRQIAVEQDGMHRGVQAYGSQNLNGSTAHGYGQ